MAAPPDEYWRLHDRLTIIYRDLEDARKKGDDTVTEKIYREKQRLEKQAAVMQRQHWDKEEQA